MLPNLKITNVQCTAMELGSGRAGDPGDGQSGRHRQRHQPHHSLQKVGAKIL